MPKFASLLWLSVLPLPVLACAPDAEPSRLRGVYQVSILPDKAQLIQVRQLNEDLAITVTSPAGTSLTYDSPAGRDAIEYVYLPSGEPGHYEICLESVFANSAPGTYEFKVSDLSDTSAGAQAAYMSATEASRLWRQAGTGNYESAAAQYTRAISGGATDETFLYFSGLNAALANFKTNRYADARLLAEAAVDNASTGEFGFLALMTRGTIAMRERRFAEALDDFLLTETAISGAEAELRVELVPEKADLYNLLALTYLSMGELERGRQYLDEALARSSTDHRLLGLIYANLGYYSMRKAEEPGIAKADAERYLSDATDQHLLARYFTYEADDIENMILIETNTAEHYRRIGERRKAQQHYSNALELLDRYEIPQIRNLLYSNLWAVNISLGDYHKALSYLESAVSLTANSGNALFIRNICRLGDTSRLMNALPSAIAYHEDCYAAAVENSNINLQAQALLNLSRDHRDAGDQALGEQQIIKAYDLLPRIDDAQLKADILAERALYFAEQKDFASAQSLFEQAVTASDKVRFAENWISIQEIGMKIALLRQDYDALKTYAYDAIAKIEEMYAAMDAERIGPAWSNRTHLIYVQLFSALLEQFATSGQTEHLQEAFLVQERGRSISMRQQLINELAYQDAPPDGPTVKLVSEASSLLAAGMQPNMNTLKIDYYHHQDLLALTRMSGFDALPIPAPLSMAAVQSKLTADELVLHYTLTEQSLYVLLISRDKVAVEQLASRTELDQELRNSLISPGNNSIAIDDLRRFANLLLPTSPELAAYSQLLIVPHSGLYQIPFAALPVNSSTNPYSALASAHVVKVLPSLSVYFMEKPDVPANTLANAPANVSASVSGNDSAAIAVIADPEFGGAESFQLANLSESEQIRSWSQSLVPLPYSAEEANNLAQIFGENNVLQYTGRRASRASLVSSNVRQAKILHIATHGYFKSTSDDNVGLALSTITEDGLPDPGYITLTELFSYHFANDLVVISGCDTAMGLEQHGAGLNSLARGFLSQGAKHVISTLWPVSDRASAKFMALFYRNLQQTRDVALALQAVQKDFMVDPLYRNPYYWAGYVLTTIDADAKLEL